MWRRVVCAVGALALVYGISMTRALDGQRHSSFEPGVATRAHGTISGTVVTDPESAAFTTNVLVRAGAPGGGHRTLLVVAASDAVSRVRVLQAGDRVRMTGRLAPLRATSFDTRAKWRHAVARLEDADLISLAAPTGLLAVADALRAFVVRGADALPPTSHALLTGFLLGDTRGIPSEIEDAYRDAGLSHLLAVSGANVAFVLALAGPVLRRLPLLSRTALALTVVLVFAAMTRFEPSILRASVMATIALLATLAGRPAARLRVLAYAVIVLLIADPFLVHSVGFVLSCGASAGIALFEPSLARRLPGPRVVREPLAVSLAAQLGVLPVLLAVFGDVPLVTPLANLLAAPAAEVLGVYGFVASGAAAVLPALGPLLHQPTALLIAWVSAVAHVGASIPLRLDARTALAVVA
jgi:competence protein ComEC